MAGEAGLGAAEVLEALGIGGGNFGLLLVFLNLGAGIAVFKAVDAMSGWLEDRVSADAKRDIAAWLRGAEIPGSVTNWPGQFAALFDRVFGTKHWSFRCFRRSCAASTLAIAGLITIWCVLNPKIAAEFFSLDHLFKWLGFEPYDRAMWLIALSYNDIALALLAIMIVFIVVTFLIVGSWVPDYLSLLESRAIVRLMTKMPSLSGIMILLALDAVLSILIFLCVAVSMLLVVSLLFGTSINDSFNRMEFHETETYYYMFSLYGMEDDFLPSSVFLYSSLLTSMWIWLYALAAVFVRATHSIASVMRFLKWFLDIDVKPIRSIGSVAGLIAAIGWWGLVMVTGPEEPPAPVVSSSTAAKMEQSR